MINTVVGFLMKDPVRLRSANLDTFVLCSERGGNGHPHGGPPNNLQTGRSGDSSKVAG